jgi:hypothetical protein
VRAIYMAPPPLVALRMTERFTKSSRNNHGPRGSEARGRIFRF